LQTRVVAKGPSTWGQKNRNWGKKTPRKKDGWTQEKRRGERSGDIQLRPNSKKKSLPSLGGRGP